MTTPSGERRKPMIQRRAVILPLLLAGCGLAERPYAERRHWPLLVPRPAVLAARGGGKVLEVRTVRAGPGLEARGFQALGPDGSIATEFYEEWSVPPAQGVEEAVRTWLGGAGVFAAVLAPGSRVAADYVIEGDLGAIWTEPAAGVAHAALGVTLIAMQAEQPRVVIQRRYRETAALAGAGAVGAAQGMLAALALVLARVEGDVRRAV